MKIHENKGWNHVFTLADGSSFRIMPRETKDIESSAVSEDIQIAVSMKLVSIYEEEPKSDSVVAKDTETTNKKSNEKLVEVNQEV